MPVWKRVIWKTQVPHLSFEKIKEKTFSVPGSDEAGGNCGAPGPPGHAGQVVLDVHVGLDVWHELDHHDVGHRVPIKLYKIFKFGLLVKKTSEVIIKDLFGSVSPTRIMDHKNPHLYQIN